MNLVDELLGLIRLDRRLQPKRDGMSTEVNATSVADFFDTTITRNPALKALITDRPKGSAMRSGVEKFRNAFCTRKQASEKVNMGVVIKAMSDFIVGLSHKVIMCSSKNGISCGS